MIEPNRRRVFPCTATVAVATLLCWLSPAASEARPVPLVGTWYLALDLSAVGLPPGSTLPAVAAFHRDGIFNISDPGDLSSVPFLELDTTQYGSWYRTEDGTYHATSLFLRKADNGELEGWHRVRFTLQLEKRSNRLVGVVTEEVLACPATGPGPFALFNCPDPITGEFTAIPTEIPISGRRLRPKR